MNQLPAELIIIIWSQIGFGDIYTTIRLVCKKWYLISMSNPYLFSLLNRVQEYLELLLECTDALIRLKMAIWYKTNIERLLWRINASKIDKCIKDRGTDLEHQFYGLVDIGYLIYNGINAAIRLNNFRISWADLSESRDVREKQLNNLVDKFVQMIDLNERSVSYERIREKIIDQFKDHLGLNTCSDDWDDLNDWDDWDDWDMGLEY